MFKIQKNESEAFFSSKSKTKRKDFFSPMIWSDRRQTGEQVKKREEPGQLWQNRWPAVGMQG